MAWTSGTGRGHWSGMTAAAAALLLAGAVEAAAGVSIRERTLYYDVSGKTGAEVYKQMARKGPSRSDGKGHFIARADISFDFGKVDAYQWGNQCRIREADVVVNIVYRMPRWSGEKSASPAMKRAWGSFLAHVWRHEKRHGEIAKDAGYQMLRLMKSLSGNVNKQCAGMKETFEQRLKDIVARHNQRQAAFDGSPWGDGGKAFRHDYGFQAAK